MRKQVIYYVAVMQMLFTYSCDSTNEERTYRFMIENKSGTPIDISIFESASNSFVRSLSIAND